jgi:alpha-beta hydrolase superfamily lysophospholipase
METRVIITSVFGVIAFLLLLKVLVIIIEPKLTFYPYRDFDETPQDYGIPFEEFYIDSTDDVQLWAWYLKHPEPIAELVFFHGNAGNISKGRLELLINLCRHGFSVFVFDYRGYGKSTGTPTESGVKADSVAAAEFFRQKIHVDRLPVIYHGRSIGGFCAAYAANQIEPDGLILEATFPDKNAVVRHFPAVMRFLALFSRYKLQTADFLKEISCPVLVIHGDEDEIVAFEAGKELYSRLNVTQKHFLRIPGAGHEDQSTTGSEVYWPGIIRFVNEMRTSTNLEFRTQNPES